MDTPSTDVGLREVVGHGGNPPGQGPYIRITLTLQGQVIQRASYETYPCPSCHATGKAVCELAEGRTVSGAGEIKWDQLVEKVGPLPRAKSHCYSLALLGLSGALGNAHRSE